VVSTAEVVAALQDALVGGLSPLCAGSDSNGDLTVSIEDLVTIVRTAATGCPVP